MKQLFTKLFEKIGFSIKEGNVYSSVRLQSFIILLPILLMTFTFIGFEITTFAMCIYLGKAYYISSEIIVIFGMILSHHLALVFSRKKSQSIAEIKGKDSTEEETAEK